MAISRSSVKQPIKPSFKLNYSLILLFLNLLLTGIYWWQLPPEIPLFFSLPYGPSQLSQRVWFFLLPGLSLFCFICFPMLTKFKVKSSLYLPMLSWLTTLSLFLLSLAMIHIIFVAL